MRGVSDEDREFLQRVAAMEQDGKQMREIAAAEGCSPGGLTYKLARLGFASRLRIVDQRTGTPLQVLLDETSRTPVPA